MTKLMLLVTVLAFAALGCQTKTAKGPEPAPVAEADSQPEEDVWTADESEPVYDDYGGGTDLDDSYSDGYDDTEG